jgi:adenosylcobinamide-phosphate synthase
MIWSEADLVVAALAVLLALAVDRWLGEPPVRLHPVVWIGHYLGWAGQRIAPAAGIPLPQRDLAAFARGAIAWCAGAILAITVALALQLGLQRLPAWGQLIALGLLLKPLLAWSMLKSEVLAVEAALSVSLQQGRGRLSWLCSRDTSVLSESQVRETALESLAENLNDSVVAPLFWFALAGLPGAALYRFANTADAMWGYRGERSGRVWEWAGKWAAHADDLLSWLPARLTALLLALAAGGLSLVRLRREARVTPSPNGGWPMGAMALALGVRLGKPGVYTLNATGQPPGPHDTDRACALAGRALGLIRFSLLILLLTQFLLPSPWPTDGGQHG